LGKKFLLKKRNGKVQQIGHYGTLEKKETAAALSAGQIGTEVLPLALFQP